MDNLRWVSNIVRQDYCTARIDLDDAYYTVPALCIDRKYLFQFEGNQMASQVQEYLPKY